MSPAMHTNKALCCGASDCWFALGLLISNIRVLCSLPTTWERERKEFDWWNGNLNVIKIFQRGFWFHALIRNTQNEKTPWSESQTNVAQVSSLPLLSDLISRRRMITTSKFHQFRFNKEIVALDWNSWNWIHCDGGKGGDGFEELILEEFYSKNRIIRIHQVESFLLCWDSTVEQQIYVCDFESRFMLSSTS